MDHEVNQSAADANRIAYFRRGYGDGAKGSAYRHPENADYMRGYNAGGVDLSNSVCAFCYREGLAIPSVLR